MARPRKTCNRCGEPAENDWSLAPCALGREIKGRLCADCDLELNEFVLSFFRVRGRKRAMEKYRDASIRHQVDSD